LVTTTNASGYEYIKERAIGWFRRNHSKSYGNFLDTFCDYIYMFIILNKYLVFEIFDV